MKPILLIVQIIGGVLLIALILLQSKGTGLSRSIASGAYHSRRGIEILVFRFTIFLSVFFVAISVINQIFL